MTRSAFTQTRLGVQKGPHKSKKKYHPMTISNVIYTVFMNFVLASIRAHRTACLTKEQHDPKEGGLGRGAIWWSYIKRTIALGPATTTGALRKLNETQRNYIAVVRLSGGHEHPWEEASPPEAGDCSPKNSMTPKALMRMGPTRTTPTPCMIVMMYGTPPPTRATATRRYGSSTPRAPS